MVIIDENYCTIVKSKNLKKSIELFIDSLKKRSKMLVN